MLTIPQRSGSQEVVFDKFKESIFSDLRVATIGVVTAVDTVGGLLTVKPIINERIVNNDGSVKWQEFPEIPDTPYIGGAPVQGALVLLVFCDHDISCLLSTTGVDTTGIPATQNQEILRSHALSNAVAITGLGTSAAASPSIAYTFGSITASRDNNGTGVSNALLQLIKSHEGCVLNWYQDIAGYWTIGIGHMNNSKVLPSGFTAPLTQETALQLLNYDINHTYLSAVLSAFSGVTLAQNQIDALTDFCYALGGGYFRSGQRLYDDIMAGVTDKSILRKDFEAYCKVNINGVLTANSYALKIRDVEWNMYCNNDYTW